ncbi:MAG: hypothetical protein EZS28_042819 [Streblomastix strix]|uniref:Uncharacterized protein n=1 Tax=Streblomastix strix TaxID=222440 RepID=A0A5J4TW95_9EUKA|nr:MAG: hypothetical protein EZS28_042819 [Streblomastix strix]
MKIELEKQERGTNAQIEQIKKKKIEICQKIIAYLLGKRDDENRKIAIDAGIIDITQTLQYFAEPCHRSTISLLEVPIQYQTIKNIQIPKLLLLEEELTNCQLFKAKEITNIEMRKDIFAYLKTALSSSESWIKNYSKWILGLLAENSSNRAEIEKDGFKIPEDND